MVERNSLKTSEVVATLKFPFISIHLGANIIKKFTAVIYCHSMVILLFCVVKLYDLGNYCGMAVNYRGICETNVIKHNLT